MLFKLTDRIYEFQIVRSANFISRHSLKELERLEVEIVLVDKNSYEELSELIDTTRQNGLISVDENKNVLKCWKINRHSSSCQPRDKYILSRHKLEIEEFEVLRPSSIEIGDLVIKTDSYHEYFSGEQLRIRAIAEITKEQQNTLKSFIDELVLVVRHGIDENPRQMVLFFGFWSETNTKVKHSIFLVEVDKESCDNQMWTNERHVLLFGTSNLSAYNQGLLDGLLSTLVDKNFLNHDEVNKIREDAKNQKKQIIYDFYKVDDLDFQL